MHWISGYLASHSQSVVANGEPSLAAPVISGSVLGPPFSDLFNNLTEINLKDGAKLALYVDYVLLF